MSVQEILEEISKLCNVAVPYMDRIDVKYAVADLMSSAEAMKEVYNTDGYSTAELEEKKGVCRADYIRLEYALVFLEEQHNRYTMRTLIRMYYNRLKRLINAIQIDKDDKLDILSMFRAVHSMMLVSCEPNFDYSHFDKDNIERKIIHYEEKYDVY